VGEDRGFSAMSDPIAIISKNSLEDIRVMWSEYKGHRYLDIRVYTEIDGKTDKVPTRKGVTVRPDLIADLIKALESAQPLPDAA
jgi:chaperone required for assembly of F1-ATPase